MSSRDNAFKVDMDDDWDEDLTGMSQQFEKRTTNIANQRKLKMRRSIEDHMEKRARKRRHRADNDEWDLIP